MFVCFVHCCLELVGLTPETSSSGGSSTCKALRTRSLISHGSLGLCLGWEEGGAGWLPLNRGRERSPGEGDRLAGDCKDGNFSSRHFGCRLPPTYPALASDWRTLFILFPPEQDVPLAFLMPSALSGLKDPWGLSPTFTPKPSPLTP